MINRQEWIRTRKHLLNQVKSLVQLRLGTPTRELRQYAKNWQSEFKGSWRISSDAQVKRMLNNSQVILSADFHAYSQSQKAHVRILRDYVQSGSVTLALECLFLDQEKWAQAFVRGRLSEAKFLEVSQWQKRWGFAWEHYRPLFELARDRGYKLVALNQKKVLSLTHRDLWAAERLIAITKSRPNDLVFAVIGENHLLDKHLPRALRKLGLKQDRLTVIFQDLETLYFKYALKEPSVATDWFLGTGRRLCFLVSPPWMKWQSYLMYLEATYDRDLQEDPILDYSEHLSSLIELLESDLKIRIKKSRLQVYNPASQESLNLLKKKLPKPFNKILIYHLEHDLSFFIPENDWLYLSRATINHASALAGQFVHAQLARRQRTLWNAPQDFLALIWVEAVGFLFSKWINPKRKADNLQAVRFQLAARQPGDSGRRALLLVLDHRLSEVIFVRTGRLRSARYNPRDIPSFVESSRIIGTMMGERLFNKVRSGLITSKDLLTYLSIPVENKSFKQKYWELVRLLEQDQGI